MSLRSHGATYNIAGRAWRVFMSRYVRMLTWSTMCCALSVGVRVAHGADADSMLGIHWWGNSYPNPPSDLSPATMLNSRQQGAYDEEIANTHNEFFWSAEWLRPLYQEIKTNQGVTPLTRINYKWGDTVPSPTLAD